MKEATYKAVIKGVKSIQKNVKYMCPVGETGHLRNSIKTRGEIKETEVIGEVYTGLEYAPYVEFGTGQRGMTSNVQAEGISYRADWPGMPAQPYLTPAYLHAKNTGEAEKEVVKAIQQEINKLGSGK